jgi:outer membrane protein OmpA-like peptidoglycan-associated protein
MPKNPPPSQEEESGEGAPLWIISFADMVSLLMAFFIMLASFSSIGDKETMELKQVMKTALAPYGGFFQTRHQPALVPMPEMEGQTDHGSEKPTLEDAKNNKGLKETKNDNFNTDKVFLIESKNVFWAKGVTLSANGKKILDTIAAFANRTPEKLIINEEGPFMKHNDLGAFRAIVVAEYLCNKGVPRNRCNIGSKCMSKTKYTGTKRMLEITLLEERTYK